ncbi:MAG: hypothetical protein WC992_05870 [Acholeplasmataceae bacterium]
MLKVQVKLTLLTELLGTSSANPALYEEFIASKGDRAEEEIAALPAVPEEELKKSTTVFHRNAEERPIIYDYQIKGFFKDACGCLRRVKGSPSAALKAYKKEIDGLIFPEPRQIVLQLPDGAEIGICERPLRAQTAAGERIALARSETVPAGTCLEFELTVLSDPLLDVIESWLDYGKLRGLGQWRNSGRGRFEYDLEVLKQPKARAKVSGA